MLGPRYYVGWGIFVTIFSQKVKVSSGIYLNKNGIKYNVCSIKLETKVMRLHRVPSGFVLFCK